MSEKPSLEDLIHKLNEARPQIEDIWYRYGEQIGDVLPLDPTDEYDRYFDLIDKIAQELWHVIDSVFGRDMPDTSEDFASNEAIIVLATRLGDYDIIIAHDPDENVLDVWIEDGGYVVWGFRLH